MGDCKRKDDFMNRLNKKQKMIVIAISIIAIVGIGYYVYGRSGTFAVEENLEIKQDERNIIDDNNNADNQTKIDKQMIKVHISGAVNNEGLIELEENSRIADAIEKAGGVKENACMEEVNLAYLLEDGMKIKIATKEEVQTQKLNNLESSGISTEIVKSNNADLGKSAESKISVSSKNNNNSKVNINTANQTELETLPGIGTATALKIINYRKENGKFKNVEDIKNVKGIGDSKFNNIKDLIII